MNNDTLQLRNQLLSYTDDIVDVISKGNSVEIKKNKDGVLALEVNKSKIKHNKTK